MSARAGYLGSGTFALIDGAGSCTSGLGILVCGPFGLEGITATRPLREWARALAADGHLVLRIDLPGTGDSAGGPRDAGLVSRWQQALADGVALLRQDHGVTRVAVIGVGLGGLLALTTEAPVDDVVAWGVPADGRRLVRELRAFARFEAVRQDEAGGVVAGGYVMTAETAEALGQIDLRALPAGALDRRRVLLVSRGDAAPDDELPAALSAAGAVVDTAAGPDFTAMTGDAAHARTPVQTIPVVGAWLGAAVGAQAGHEAPLLEPALTGGGVREEPAWIALPGAELFAIHTGPADAKPGVDGLLFLNAGALNRTGPNRLWVQIARRWAERGVPSLRVDLAGIGESDGDTGELDDDAGFYRDLYVDQVLELLDALERRWGIRRVAVIGLCSGAYTALHVAAADDRVVSAVMLNPRALIWDQRLVYRRNLRRARKIVLPRTWHKVPHRRREAVATLSAVRSAGLGRRQDLDAAIRTLLDRVAERGARVLLLFSGEEPLDRELAAKGLWDELERWPAIRHERLAEHPETHTLRPLPIQATVIERIDEALGDVF